MLKGRLPPPPREKQGGSMRRGLLLEVDLRLERREMRLCFGEPREEAMGVLAVVAGTERERGFLDLGEAIGRLVTRLAMGAKREEVAAEGDLDVKSNVGSVRTNLEAFCGVPSMFLERLEGELKIEGSMFSESMSSSKNVGECRRFSGEDRLAFSGVDRDAWIAVDSTCEYRVLI